MHNSTKNEILKFLGHKNNCSIGISENCLIPIQVATTVKIIDIITTIIKQLTIIWAAKRSPLPMTLAVSFEAGSWVSKTSKMTTSQIKGSTSRVYRQVAKRTPISKQVISGAMIFTDNTETIATKKRKDTFYRVLCAEPLSAVHAIPYA
ncbi:hypothetical protein [Enterococcus diestrammenae]|uniref:Uncharacterized protein n=1 Tax=Enterococcus diestrammenae TaxID=1155073 RepID=A0ABV0F7I1_9ENTE|nr:hypothetical protein [Enterococcus diestrammenae]KAF1296935.1 hypothetical protein BAU18_14545 [Enterococcus diestrammenae]